MKKHLTVLLATALGCAFLIGNGLSASASDVFNDVSEKDWYYQSVSDAYDHGLMQGTGSGCFSPDDTLTTAEAVTIAARLHAGINGKTIIDADGEWYAPYTAYAMENGFLSADTFDSFERPIRRHEMASLFADASDVLPVINAVSSVPDVPFDAPYAAKVMKLYRGGILSGNDALGTFAPDTELLRCEMAAMAVRFAVPERRVVKDFAAQTPRTLSDAFSLIDTPTGSGPSGIANGWNYDDRFDLLNTTGASYHAIYDEDDEKFTAMTREFEPCTRGTLHFETRLTVSSKNGGFRLAFENKNNGDGLFGITEADGFLALFGTQTYVTGIPFPTAAADMAVVMDIDLDLRSAAVYIDNTFAGYIALPDGEVSRLAIRTERTGQASAVLHQTRLDANYALREHFFVLDKNARMTPVGWNTDGFALKRIESEAGDDVYSLYAAGAAHAERAFRKTGGDTAFETYVLLPEGADGFSASLTADGEKILTLTTKDGAFYAGNEKLRGFTANVWQILRVETDMTTKRAVVKIDGKVCGTLPYEAAYINGVSFDFDPSDGAQAYIDDVSVQSLVAHDDYPAPPVTDGSKDDYNIIMNMCDLWRDGQSGEGWDAVSAFEEFTPLLGYYDEGLPETADYECKQMAEHAVDAMHVCWYAPYTDMKAPVKRMKMSHAALHDGYMNAKYSDRVKFCIMWENNDAYFGASDFEQFKEYIWKYWKEYYFTDERYLTLDGKAVLSVWNMSNLAKTFGSEAGILEAKAFMEEELKALGYDGLLLLTNVNTLQTASGYASLAARGIDATYAYSWGTMGYMPEYQISSNRTAQSTAGDTLWCIPTVSIGYNGIGRYYYRYPIISAADHRAVCLDIKDILDGSHTGTWKDNTLFVSTWNEYSEGTYIAPTASTGYAYLDNLSAVFGNGTPASNERPTEEQKARVTHLYPDGRSVMRRYLFEKTDEEKKVEDIEHFEPVVTYDMKKEEDAAAWSGMFGLADFYRKDGVIGGSSEKTDYAVLCSSLRGLKAADAEILHLRMKASKARSIEIFFITSHDSVWNNVKRFVVTQTAADEFVDYYVNMSVNEHWKGDITAVRIDPCTDSASFAFSVIEFMRCPRKETAAVEVNGRPLTFVFDPVPTPDGDYEVVGEQKAGFYSHLRVYVEWNRFDGELTVKTRDKKTLVFTVGKDTVTVNGEAKPLGYTFTLRDGLPVFRLKALCALLGYPVTDDGKTVSVKAASDDELAYLASRRENAWYFDHPGDMEGWTSANGTAQVANGVLRGTPSNGDPYIRRAVSFDADAYTHGILRMRRSAALNVAQLFFITDTAGSYSADKCIGVEYKSVVPQDVKDGDIVEVLFDLHSNARFTGTITGLRIDPLISTEPYEIEEFYLVYDETLPHTEPEPIEEAPAPVKTVYPTEVTADVYNIPVGVRIFTDANSEISAVEDPDDPGHLVWSVTSVSGTETYTYFNVAMNFVRGATYEVTYTYYPTEDYNGVVYGGTTIAGNFRYGTGNGVVPNHTFGNQPAKSLSWQTTTIRTKIEDSYVPHANDYFQIWAQPNGNVGVNFLVKKVDIRIVEQPE